MNGLMPLKKRKKLREYVEICTHPHRDSPIFIKDVRRAIFKNEISKGTISFVTHGIYSMFALGCLGTGYVLEKNIVTPNEYRSVMNDHSNAVKTINNLDRMESPLSKLEKIGVDTKDLESRLSELRTKTLDERNYIESSPGYIAYSNLKEKNTKRALPLFIYTWTCLLGGIVFNQLANKKRYTALNKEMNQAYIKELTRNIYRATHLQN